ncbi:MAG: asparaginase [Rhodobacteraceae bacterium]|nr:asparaginase [Paracoccaceae bacterium]
MNSAVPLCEVWRGPMIESVHMGHAVVCDDTGQIIKSWGDPDAIVYPRSSSKMIQALPLVASGAADRFGLTDRHLALACASHNGAHIHTGLAQTWLADLGLGDDDLRCGSQVPRDSAARDDIFTGRVERCQVHNNSPNHATTLAAMARAMAWFASAHERADTLSQAAVKLRSAMMTYPELVAGEGRACTELMRALDGHVALKTGAEGYFIAIIPDRKLGIALKISDGATRASECAITALLVGLGVLAADHPVALRFMSPKLLNRRGIECGYIRPSADLLT